MKNSGVVTFYKLLDKLSPEQESYLKSNTRELVYKKGENICKQGTYMTHIMYVKSGFAKLVYENSGNKNIISRFLKKSDFIGLSSLDQQNIYHYTSIALNDVEIAIIEKNCFLDLMFRNIDAFHEIISYYSLGMNALAERFVQVGTKQVHGRLADAIIMLSHEDYNGLYEFISRKDLAEYVGMSVKSMIRSLKELKNDGIILIEGKKIIVNNFDLLERLSRIG